jgi:hypothetical protein
VTYFTPGVLQMRGFLLTDKSSGLTETGGVTIKAPSNFLRAKLLFESFDTSKRGTFSGIRDEIFVLVFMTILAGRGTDVSRRLLGCRGAYQALCQDDLKYYRENGCPPLQIYITRCPFRPGYTE